MERFLRGSNLMVGLCLLSLPGLAIAGELPVLYDQLDMSTGEGFVATNFDEPIGLDSEGADDFFVDSPDGWTIEAVENIGFYNLGVGPAASVNVRFYAPEVIENGVTFPGEVLCNYTGLIPDTAADGNFFLTLPTPCELEQGSYWFSIQASMSQLDGQYRWGSRSASNGSGGVWRNPPDGSGFGCVDWTFMEDCGTASGTDYLFRLYGVPSAFFEDDFESGDLTAWSNSSGNVAATGDAALEGHFGLEATVDGSATKSWVQSSDPSGLFGDIVPFGISGLDTYRFNFSLDMNSVDLGVEAPVEIARLYDTSLNKIVRLSVRIKSNGSYKLSVNVQDDTGAKFPIGQTSVGASGVTELSVEWSAGTGTAVPGILRLFRNGSLKIENTMLDTDMQAVAALRLGLPKGSADITGHGGAVYFDDFESFTFLEELKP